MTAAIPGNNDLFLVISGFRWCSSSASPRLPSSTKTRPWVSSREQLKPPHLSSWAFPCPWCCPSRHHTSSVNYPSWKWDQNHVSTVQGYLLQLCLLHKNPPVAPLAIQPCQTAGVSVYLLLKLKHGQAGKFASRSQAILCLRVAPAEQPRAGRLLLWPSLSWVLWREGGQRWRSPLCCPPGQRSIPWHSLKKEEWMCNPSRPLNKLK